MRWPTSETLDLVEHFIPQSIVTSETLAQIKRLATQIPPGMSSYYLECRLRREASQIDFLTCAAVPEGGRDQLAKSEHFPPELLTIPSWKRILHFCQQWANPDSILHNRVPLVWFEFDQANKPLTGSPLSSFCFCLDLTYLQKGAWSQRRGNFNVEQCQETMNVGLQLLLDQFSPSQHHHNLFTCFTALPPKGRIIHISAMLARQPVVTKLYGFVPKDQLAAYLTRLEWPGSLLELESILQTFCTSKTMDDNIYIDLSIEEQVQARLGIAFARQQIENLATKDQTRRDLLDLCVQHGLCTPEKRDALIAWPGDFRAVFRGEALPARFRRWLDIKLVYQPGQPLEAKAYLGFMPYFSFF